MSTLWKENQRRHERQVISLVTKQSVNTIFAATAALESVEQQQQLAMKEQPSPTPFNGR